MVTMTEPFRSFTVPLEPTAVGEARHRLRDVLGRAAVPPAVIEDAALVLSELVTNAIRHARPTPAQEAVVEVSLAGAALHLAVTDGGGAQVPVPVSAPLADPGGRGLALVDLLTDRWWWENTAGGRTVHAVLGLPAAR
ncbi:hypothetical protein ASE19_01885 [Nocardioides sp. Root79]|nr:hypothetical protein ASE19_01885 [Nocardioides sp. Root79]KRC76821.1 hypothetical protein ASE20_00755 [Nocardioides sp. Root240]